MQSGDVHTLNGIGSIINKDNSRPGIDLKELERKMISGGLIQKRTKDPQDKFNEELKEATRKLGINFDNFTKNNKNPQPEQIKSNKLPQVALDSYVQNVQPKETKENTESESDDEIIQPDENNQNTQNTQQNTQQSPAYSSTYDSSGQSYPDTNRFLSDSRPKFGEDLQSKTQEQQKRDHIDFIVGTSEDSFSFEKEKREDMKCGMLAEIDSLISALSDDDIDLTRIPKVNQDSDYATVESVLKMLRHKNDHARYCSFADEFILFGAYALEELFDGKRTWFGRYRPDLTGWHNNVNMKLKRMRHDTGQIVSSVLQDYQIGSGMRILLELVPSMVLYSKLKKSQYAQPGLYNDDEMSAATQHIRNLSE